MAATTKFITFLHPQADHDLDKIENEVLREKVLEWTAAVLPNIKRRDALLGATTPIGTLFTFQVDSTQVLAQCLNGHDKDGNRVMIVTGFAKLGH